MFETYLQRQLLLAAVQRQIFCPHTGVVLDVRTAVLISDPGNGRCLTIIDGSAWDKVKDEALARLGEVEIIDGRELAKRRRAGD